MATNDANSVPPSQIRKPASPAGGRAPAGKVDPIPDAEPREQQLGAAKASLQAANHAFGQHQFDVAAQHYMLASLILEHTEGAEDTYKTCLMRLSACYTILNRPEDAREANKAVLTIESRQHLQTLVDQCLVLIRQSNYAVAEALIVDGLKFGAQSLPDYDPLIERLHEILSEVQVMLGKEESISRVPGSADRPLEPEHDGASPAGKGPVTITLNEVPVFPQSEVLGGTVDPPSYPAPYPPPDQAVAKTDLTSTLNDLPVFSESESLTTESENQHSGGPALDVLKPAVPLETVPVADIKEVPSAAKPLTSTPLTATLNEIPVFLDSETLSADPELQSYVIDAQIVETRSLTPVSKPFTSTLSEIPVFSESEALGADQNQTSTLNEVPVFSESEALIADVETPLGKAPAPETKAIDSWVKPLTSTLNEMPVFSESESLVEAADDSPQSVSRLSATTNSQIKGKGLTSTLNEIPVFSDQESLALETYPELGASELAVADTQIMQEPEVSPTSNRISSGPERGEAGADPRSMVSRTLNEIPVFVDSEALYAEEEEDHAWPFLPHEVRAMTMPEAPVNRSDAHQKPSGTNAKVVVPPVQQSLPMNSNVEVPAIQQPPAMNSIVEVPTIQQPPAMNSIVEVPTIQLRAATKSNDEVPTIPQPAAMKSNVEVPTARQSSTEKQQPQKKVTPAKEITPTIVEKALTPSSLPTQKKQTQPNPASPQKFDWAQIHRAAASTNQWTGEAFSVGPQVAHDYLESIDMMKERSEEYAEENEEDELYQEEYHEEYEEAGELEAVPVLKRTGEFRIRSGSLPPALKRRLQDRAATSSTRVTKTNKRKSDEDEKGFRSLASILVIGLVVVVVILFLVQLFLHTKTGFTSIPSPPDHHPTTTKSPLNHR